MFDIGLTEIIVIAVVSSVMLDVKDIPKIVKFVKQAVNYCNDIIADIKNIFSDLEKEANKIIDLDGNEQITYDLSDIMPDIKASESSSKIKTLEEKTSLPKKIDGTSLKK